MGAAGLRISISTASINGCSVRCRDCFGDRLDQPEWRPLDDFANDFVQVAVADRLVNVIVPACRLEVAIGVDIDAKSLPEARFLRVDPMITIEAYPPEQDVVRHDFQPFSVAAPF